MKKLYTGTGVLLGGLLMLTLSAKGSGVTREMQAVVVGTFDSRAVAVAYVQSDAFADYLALQRADISQALERARAAGDRELAADLSALGPEMQKRLHRQGFGAVPVDDIIERLKPRLPGIAEEAGVDVIVSKWTLAYRSPSAKLVDVTGLIVAEFNPDERTLKMVQSTIETEPIPLDEIDNSH